MITTVRGTPSFIASSLEEKTGVFYCFADEGNGDPVTADILYAFTSEGREERIDPLEGAAAVGKEAKGIDLLDGIVIDVCVKVGAGLQGKRVWSEPTHEIEGIVALSEIDEISFGVETFGREAPGVKAFLDIFTEGRKGLAFDKIAGFIDEGSDVAKAICERRIGMGADFDESR
jgi:hypothetical protein